MLKCCEYFFGELDLVLDMIGSELNTMSGGTNRVFPERLLWCGRRKGEKRER